MCVTSPTPTSSWWPGERSAYLCTDRLTGLWHSRRSDFDQNKIKHRVLADDITQLIPSWLPCGGIRTIPLQIWSIRMQIWTIQMELEALECKFKPFRDSNHFECKLEPFKQNVNPSNANWNHSNGNSNHSFANLNANSNHSNANNSIADLKHSNGNSNANLNHLNKIRCIQIQIQSTQMQIWTIWTGFKAFECKFKPMEWNFEPIEWKLKPFKCNSNHSNGALAWQWTSRRPSLCLWEMGYRTRTCSQLS